jgi:hypothetical protein
MQVGTRVRVKSNASGSDAYYAGRKGIVIEFDPTRRWQSPRALLAPDQFVCVHFFPKSKRDNADGSPIDLLDESNLEPISSGT